MTRNDLMRLSQHIQKSVVRHRLFKKMKLKTLQMLRPTINWSNLEACILQCYRKEGADRSQTDRRSESVEQSLNYLLLATGSTWRSSGRRRTSYIAKGGRWDKGPRKFLM